MSVAAAMRKCRSGNALELEFRRQLRQALGASVRFEAADLPGTPDAVVDARRTVIFLHGCFWHGCRWHGTLPRANREFWRRKFLANRARDARATADLRRAGWRVLVLWEHEMRLSGVARIVACIGR